MKKHLFLLLGSLILWSCNSDRFINDITVNKDTIILGKGLISEIIDVTGDWHSITLCSDNNVSFTLIDEYGNKTTRQDYSATLRGKGSLSLESPVRKITVNYSGNNRIVVTANYLIGAQPENYSISIEGDVVHRTIPLTVVPTHRFDIENVTYRLDLWDTWPDSCYDKILSVVMYEPVDVPGDYLFSYFGVGQLESLGQMIFTEENDISLALCESGDYYIDIPSSTGSDYEPWRMEGDEMVLSTGLSEVTFHSMPKQPDFEPLPGSCATRLTLTAKMEKIGFGCKLIVRNPVSEQRYTLYATLQIDMPVRIEGSYEIL